jgi:hypothetical protein
MDPSARNLALRRLLEGYRFRVQSRSCVVAKAHIEANALVLEFTDAPKHSVSIELPEGFDIEASDHIAWLFFNIERALAKPAT